MNFGKALCACGLHDWSCVEPGTVYIKDGTYAVLGVLWVQIGTRTCMREGCEAQQQVVREGEHGVEGLNIVDGFHALAGTCFQMWQRDTQTGWGWSNLDPETVATFEPYTHPATLDQLGVRVDA